MMDIQTSSVLGSRQNSPLDALAKDADSLSKAAKSAAQSSTQSGTAPAQTPGDSAKGDVVHISDEARKLNEQAKADADAKAAPETPSVTPEEEISSMQDFLSESRPLETVFASGTRVNVYMHKSEAKEGAAPTSTLMARVIHTDGREESWAVKSNTLITEDESGNLQVRTYARGDEMIGTDGADIMLAVSGSGKIDGGSGNDLIVDLGEEKRISGGDGNDTILSERGYIDAGAGDDTVVVNKVAEVNLGDGNNTIISATNNNSFSGSAKIIAGDGKNTIYAKNYSGGIALGNGDNTINIGTLQNSRVTTGDGHNAMRFGTAMSNIEIRTGNGNNNIEMETAFLGVDIKTGNGKDTVKIGDATLARIETGGGDDYVEIDNLNMGVVYTQGGNDTLRVNNNMGSRANTLFAAMVDMGDGDDVVTVGGDVYNAQIDMGAGNDRLTIDGSTFLSNIYTEAGDDMVSILGMFIKSRVDRGTGNDTIDIANELFSQVVPDEQPQDNAGVDMAQVG